jgi:hypothetical protein
MLRFVSQLPVLVPIMISFLLGSVECRAQCATPETSSLPTLPANTPVQLGLTKTLYSNRVDNGPDLRIDSQSLAGVCWGRFLSNGVPLSTAREIVGIETPNRLAIVVIFIPSSRS